METKKRLEELLDGGKVAVYQVDELSGRIPASPMEWSYKGIAGVVPLSEMRLQELGTSVALSVLQFEPNYTHMLFGKLLVNQEPPGSNLCLGKCVEEHWIELNCHNLDVTFDFASLESEKRITADTNSLHYVIDHIPYT